MTATVARVLFSIYRLTGKEKRVKSTVSSPHRIRKRNISSSLRARPTALVRKKASWLFRLCSFAPRKTQRIQIR